MSEKTADFIMKNLYSKNDGVYHYYSGQKHLNGFLSDNVLFGSALIDLYNATGESRYIHVAGDIAHLLIDRFYDYENKQFRPTLDTTGVKPSTAGALLDYHTTLSNYRAVIFLTRLYYNKGSEKMKKIIDETSAKLRNTYEHFEPSAPLYGTALRWSLEEPLGITIVSNGKKAGRFLLEVNKIYIPQKVVTILSLKRDRDRIKKLGYPLEEAAYVCSGKRCSPAFSRPEALITGIKRFMENLNRRDQ
jgi:uncharacterized protein YyaL (SSP411 family)